MKHLIFILLGMSLTACGSAEDASRELATRVEGVTCGEVVLCLDRCERFASEERAAWGSTHGEGGAMVGLNTLTTCKALPIDPYDSSRWPERGDF